MVVMATALPLPAQADTPSCAPRHKLTADLAMKYGEIAFASGFTINQSIKFYGNAKTGSWPVVAINTDGVACGVAVGDGLEIMLLALAQGASY